MHRSRRLSTPDLQVDAEGLAKIGDLAASADIGRIHMFAWRDLADIEAGGSEIHAAMVARIWAQAGLDVTMRTSWAQGSPKVATRDGYRVIRKAGRYAVFPRAIGSELAGRHGKRDALIEIWNGMPFLSPLWARGPRAIFLHHHHEKMWPLVLSPKLAKMGATFEQHVAPKLYRSSPIITLSNSSRDELVSKLGMTPSQVHVVPPGVDPRFAPGQTKSAVPLVVAVGRLMPSKRFDALIDTMVDVRKHVPDAELVIVGEGYELDNIEAQIRDLDASDWVSLPGRVDDAELVELYQQAWVVASASISEGWGMTLTEAASCGTPSVATDIAGHRDAVEDGVSGILVQDQDDFAGALISILRDDERRERLSVGARSHGQSFYVGSHGARCTRRAGRRRCPQASSPRVNATAPQNLFHRVRQRISADVLFVVALTYIPLFWSKPGKVGADTKPYLYLDPGRLLEGASSMWQPDVGLGAVPHQNIGYLWPMGPYYWVMETLGFPDWVAQRIWISTTICAAVLGTRYLLRTLGWRNSGVIIASLAYGFSPYGLAYFARISAILLPWAGLPWMLGLTVAAVRSKGWRHPALFALVAATVGSTNATSLLLIGLAPVLWLFYLALTERSFASVLKPGVRIGLLTGLTGLWWVAGVRTQGTFGPPVLRFTETYEAVADSSTAPEILRGLGYWFFYGNDHLGQWVEPSRAFTARTLVLILSFAIPIMALAAGAATRFRDRAYFLALIVIGTLIGVAGHPFDAPSALGQLFKDFTRTDAGLALRSTPRATPLVALGMAVMLGAGVAALARYRPRFERHAKYGVGLLVILNFAPLWNGQMVAQFLQRPENIPTYWTDAIADLDAAGPESRILEVPGSDFTSYRWGNTVEPITPGLTSRPYIARELVPFGSEPSVALTLALDKTFQEGGYNADALAPLARLMSVGDIVLRADLQFERFRTPRPQQTWGDLLRSPGLAEPVGYGEVVPNVAGPEQPSSTRFRWPSSPTHRTAAGCGVLGGRSPADHPSSVHRRCHIIAGDAESLIDAAALGLIDPDQLVVFSATLADDPELEALLLDSSSLLLLTDGNRKVARRWGTIRENTGYIEQADEDAIVFDPADYRLNVFGSEGDDPGAAPDPATQTVAIQDGATVTATDYGNPVTFTVDDRAASALDGDLDTAWRVGAFAEVVGERLIIDLPAVQPVSQIQLTQPLIGFKNRWITRLRIHANGQFTDVELGVDSLGAGGETVELTLGDTDRIELEILETNLGQRPRYNGASSVGFAEVGIDGIRFTETIRLPTDLLERVPDDLEHSLGVTVTRTRSERSRTCSVRPEESLRRTFSLRRRVRSRSDGEARISGLRQ